MQSQAIHRISASTALSIRSSIGQVSQIRNHVKMYPWRSNRGNRESYLDNTKTPYTDRMNINEFMNKKKQKKEWQKVVPKDKDNRYNSYKFHESYESDPKVAKQSARGKFESFYNSVQNRGSARESKPYDPPENVVERILTIIRSSHLTSGEAEESSVYQSDEAIMSVDLSKNSALKFNIISKCVEDFQHHMPSSFLDEMQSVKDIVAYYSKPVRGISPYDRLLHQGDELPVNLALISDALRYNRDADETFGGYTAFPGMVNIVPGVRGSKKYKTLNQDEFQWPDI